MDFVFLYSTFSNDEVAQKIAHTLLTEKLIAFANIFPGGRSMYWWKGAIEQSRETYVLFKTTAALAPRAQLRLEALRPYTIPCLVTLPVLEVNRIYAQWLKGSTFGLAPLLPE